jgi:methyl-accepting chemotaxis protein
VVASEVKTLATQTAKATGEIGAQIGAMQGEVAQAVGALRSIGDTIQRMNEIATAIAGAVEEQGATTQEIARAVQHAAIGTSEVSGNISTVRNSVDHTGRQAEAVLEAAKALTAQSDTLKAEVASFLTAVQEAA